jgi:hypothetical protein
MGAPRGMYGGGKHIYRILLRRSEGMTARKTEAYMEVSMRKMLKKQDSRTWTEIFRLRIGRMAGFCEHGDEISSCIQYGNLLD